MVAAAGYNLRKRQNNAADSQENPLKKRHPQSGIRDQSTHSIFRVILKWSLAIIFSSVLLVTLVYLWPSKFTAKPFRFPEAPALEGPLAPNKDLAQAKQAFKGLLKGPEAIVVQDDVLYTGTADGKLLKIKDNQISVLARFGPRDKCNDVDPYDEETCGRPLGMVVSPRDGHLWVLDSVLGLHKVNMSSGEFQRVVPGDKPMGGHYPRFLNDVSVASSTGRIYMSDSSVKWRRSEFYILGLETNPDGRILEFDPETGETVEVCTGISPNGIQITPDEQSLLLSDTSSARIFRCHIAGEKRGQLDIAMEHVPGFPDNIRLTERGTYWVALTAVRYPPTLMENIGPCPFLKDMAYKVSMIWNSKPVKVIRSFFPASKPAPMRNKMYGLIFEIEQSGKVLRSLHDPSSHIHGVSHVQEHQGTLYLGSASNDYIGILKL